MQKKTQDQSPPVLPLPKSVEVPAGLAGSVTDTGKPIGGFLYGIGGLLLLSCLGGFQSLILFTLGDPQAAFPDAPQMFLLVQTGVTGGAFALHLWAAFLFLSRSRRFPNVFAVAISANFVFSSTMAYWAASFMPADDGALPRLMASGLLTVVLILYCKKSQRAVATFVKR